MIAFVEMSLCVARFCMLAFRMSIQKTTRELKSDVSGLQAFPLPVAPVDPGVGRLLLISRWILGNLFGVWLLDQLSPSRNS